MLNRLIRLKKKRKVIGRGGDKGGTSGKGHKGQKARSGGFVKAQFEGGQTPLIRRLPKRGFNNYNFCCKYSVISLTVLNRIAIEEKIIDINKDVLVSFGVIKNKKENVKILSNGIITQKVNVFVDAYSKSALLAIEAAGGSIVISKTKIA